MQYAKFITKDSYITMTPEFFAWYAMHAKCDEHSQYKNANPNSNYTMSENFKNFQYFAAWCNKQVGFGNKNADGSYWEMRCNIVSLINEVFDEENCVFVPKDVANFFTVESNKAKHKLVKG